MVVTLLTDLAETLTTDDTVEPVVSADHERDHDQLLYMGWEGKQRVFDPALYIRLRNGKVWIEYNALPERIGERLVAAGVPREQIVLGFQPTHLRPSPTSLRRKLLCSIDTPANVASARLRAFVCSGRQEGSSSGCISALLGELRDAYVA